MTKCAFPKNIVCFHLTQVDFIEIATLYRDLIFHQSCNRSRFLLTSISTGRNGQPGPDRSFTVTGYKSVFHGTFRDKTLIIWFLTGTVF